MSFAKSGMRAATDAVDGREVTTLLDVVNAVAEVARDDNEAVAVILHLLASGQVRLLGEFTERDFGFA